MLIINKIRNSDLVFLIFLYVAVSLSLPLTSAESNQGNLILPGHEDRLCSGTIKQYDLMMDDGKWNHGKPSRIELIGPNWIKLGDKNSAVEADAPSHASGKFTITLQRLDGNGSMIRSETFVIDVISEQDCYNAEFLAGDVIKSDLSPAIIPLSIRNSGIKNADYSVGFEGPEWFRAFPGRLNVNPGQYANLNLNISPEEEIAAGIYPVKILLKEKGAEYAKEINLELRGKGRLSFSKLKYFLYLNTSLIYGFLFAAALASLSFLLLKKIRKRRGKIKLRRGNLRRLAFFMLILAAIYSLLLFSTYKFDFPFSKEFIGKNYISIIFGVVISLLAILGFENYRKRGFQV